jgi:hypothetical protein
LRIVNWPNDQLFLCVYSLCVVVFLEEAFGLRGSRRVDRVNSGDDRLSSAEKLIYLRGK